MAYSSTWRTINTTATATIRRRSTESVFATNSCYYLVFSNVYAQNQCKRSGLVTSSIEPSSSCSQTTLVKTSKISLKNVKPSDCSISIVYTDESGLGVEEKKAIENGIQPVSKKKKRSIWRKILSGSKKLKSIALLNVITVVYGIFFLILI